MIGCLEFSGVLSRPSPADSDYRELMEVKAIAADGTSVSAAGTLIGKANAPRLIALHDREVEAAPAGALLIYENHDEPGIIGMVRPFMGPDKGHIAAHQSAAHADDADP